MIILKIQDELCFSGTFYSVNLQVTNISRPACPQTQYFADFFAQFRDLVLVAFLTAPRTSLTICGRLGERRRVGGGHEARGRSGAAEVRVRRIVAAAPGKRRTRTPPWRWLKKKIFFKF